MLLHQLCVEKTASRFSVQSSQVSRLGASASPKYPAHAIDMLIIICMLFKCFSTMIALGAMFEERS